MKNTISIGIDLGHSSVKTAIKSGNKLPVIGGYTIFPTVVRNWIPIANEETARRAEADTVEINGKKFFVGETAQRQSQAETFTGQNRNWIATEQHDALLSRARGVLQPLVKPNQDLQIYVETQSRAPLLCIVFDAYGQETGRAGEEEIWGVVEIGQFTTDFTLHDRGQEVDAAASSARGVSMIYDRIAVTFKQRGYEASYEQISRAIQSRKIKDFGKEVDVNDIVQPAISEFTTYILDEVASRFGSKARSMDGIIVAGGGAYIVGQEIKAKYPNTIIPAQARFAVAEGYSRFGLLTLM